MSGDRPRGAHGVELWWLELDAPPSVVRCLETVLAPDELIRADRCRAERDRRRCVLRRAALREILGGRLGIPPADVRLSYGPHGKPAVPGGVKFSSSHSGRVGLCAVTDGGEVGVDVERVRSGLDVASLSERFFTPSERAALREAPASGFFAVWTLKEAILKAWGTGLSVAPETVDVSLALAGSATLDGHWTLRRVDAGEGVAAGVAVEGSVLDVAWRRWSPT